MKWSCQGYSVDQSVSESIEVRLPVPKGTKGKGIECKFSPAHLKVGLKGSPLLVDVSSPLSLCWILVACLTEQLSQRLWCGSRGRFFTGWWLTSPRGRLSRVKPWW